MRDHGIEYNQAANLEFRIAQAAKLLSGIDVDALPLNVRTDYEAIARFHARVLMACREITASDCPTCEKQMDLDLACDCFQTVAAE